MKLQKLTLSPGTPKRKLAAFATLGQEAPIARWRNVPPGLTHVVARTAREITLAGTALAEVSAITLPAYATASVACMAPNAIRKPSLDNVATINVCSYIMFCGGV